MTGAVAVPTPTEQDGPGDRQVFDDLRILDLSRWVAGEYATKLFADFGADVVKVEKPGEGSLTRRWGPFPDDVVDPERSALFLHLNTNKRSIVLDLTEPADQQVLLDLVAGADALVESFRPGTLERWGLSPQVMLERNPALVVTRISAFGQSGPRSGWEATGLTLQATGGPMNATGAAGRPPQRKPGNLEHYTIGRTAGEATLAGILAARRSGRGSVIDVSGQEVLLSGADRRASYLVSHSFSGWIPPRGVRSAHRSGTTFTGPFPAADGFVMVYITTRDFWNRFVTLISDGDRTFLDRYLDREALGDDWDAFDAHVRRWFGARGKREIMDLGTAAKIPLTALLEMPEVLANEHFRDRGAFVAVDHPRAGSLEYTGPPWRMAHGHRLRRSAPLLGADGGSVSADLSTGRWSRDSRPPREPGHRDGPLAGVRVVDLTVVWSGPGATALLGDLGAEVIRLEGNNRASRQVSRSVTRETFRRTGYHGGTYPDRDPEPRPYDRTALFAWHARNKLAACCNLETPEGRQAALDLLAVSDVLVENNSNGTLEKLGLGHDELLALNPRLIVVRMPPMGMTGPMSRYVGYGPNFNALVGIAAMDGYRGETPESAGENYHMDEAAPAGAAFAVLSALWDRDRTGRGGLVEFPQAEAVMAEVGEFLLDVQVNGRTPAILGNGDPHLWQDVFECEVDDRWVAVSIRHDRDRAAVLRVLGEAERDDGGPEGPDTASLRDRLGSWIAARSAEQVCGSLQAAGVPAGEVMAEDRLLADPHLRERGWFVRRHHPAIGTHDFPGHPWRTDGFPLLHGRPLPAFGEDNDYVYRTVLGYDDRRYEDLRNSGAVTTEQLV